MPLLEIRNLVVRYGEIEALRGVTCAVEEGQVVTLLGANGAGKSTTLRAISGLAKPTSGDILYDGKSIAGLGPEAIVRMGISHVPEGRRVFPGLTVKENIMLGASNRRAATSEISREADAMFDLFPDIRKFTNALGWTLSGGQLQMVAVARGLMAKPRLLLLDEPSLGLAPVIVQAVFKIISEIRRNTTVLLVEQNARMGLSVADYGYVLETGRIVLGGKPRRALGQRSHPCRLSRRPCQGECLGHDPEKCAAVFRKDHAQTITGRSIHGHDPGPEPHRFRRRGIRPRGLLSGGGEADCDLSDHGQSHRP
ncbi:branched-chain amino acid transport system ATP-binding protein [Bradyrhizobium sp. LM3.2]